MKSRPRPLSGFPEFLPSGRIVEQRVLDLLRHEFELHGFASVETRAVEPLSVLAGKGEIDKEVYAVRRLHADAETADELGLRYDNTVPFARYVTEFAGKLSFPFRRYQIQKVWRGERPQQGRYREFTQADIDIVGMDALPTHHDVEIPLVMLGAFDRLSDELGLPAVTMHVSNRKIAQGYFGGLGVADPSAVMQRLDKLDKIGPEKVARLLVDEVGLSAELATRCLQLAEITSHDLAFVGQVRALGVGDPMLEEGLSELAEVIGTVSAYRPGRVVADLRIARVLDYYTGTVYETLLDGFADLGSICSGGRYDALADDGRQTYPGVGISVGISRLLAPLILDGTATASRSVPSVVLVAVTDEQQRVEALAVASALRARDIPTEVAPKADKFGKQIRYAERRGIPYVWFGANQVRDIRSGDQVAADSAAWSPPAADLVPSVSLRPASDN